MLVKVKVTYQRTFENVPSQPDAMRIALTQVPRGTTNVIIECWTPRIAGAEEYIRPLKEIIPDQVAPPAPVEVAHEAPTALADPNEIPF